MIAASSLTATVYFIVVALLVFSFICMILFRFFAKPIVSVFIADEATVSQGAYILKGRCFALPFMLIGYQVVNFMNAVDKGNISFLLAIIRHLVLIIPLAVIMNSILGLNGLVWSQPVADVINTVISIVLLYRFSRCIPETAHCQDTT